MEPCIASLSKDSGGGIVICGIPGVNMGGTGCVGGGGNVVGWGICNMGGIPVAPWKFGFKLSPP